MQSSEEPSKVVRSRSGNPFYLASTNQLDITQVSQWQVEQSKFLPLDISQIVPEQNIDDWGPDIFAEQVTVLHEFFHENQIPEQSEETSSVCSIDEIILSEARMLKKNIMDLLEIYSRSVQVQKTQTLKQFSKDTLKIQSQYDNLVELQKKSSQTNREVRQIMKMGEEFLTKFNKKKTLNLSQSFDSDTQCSFTFKDPSKLILTINKKMQNKLNQLSALISEQMPNLSKTWKKLEELVLEISVSNSCSTQFKDVRMLSKQFSECSNEELKKEIKKIVKTCYLKYKILEGNDVTKNVSKESTRITTCPDIQIKNSEKKRKFFDFALKAKFSLPRDHPAQKIMISTLFERAQLLPESSWEKFLKEELK